MDPVFSPAVEAYLARTALLAPPPHPVLEEMRLLANERNFPIVGPETGRFFLQLAALHRPRRILELGSGFGYSALWWAFGCPSAEIHLTDHRRANLDDALRFAERAGVAPQFVTHTGDALKSARAIEGPWDVIFCDIDKQEYPGALEFALEQLKPGGLLLFDNMLWHGKVVLAADDRDAATQAVVETTRCIYTDPRWAPSLIPVRDGVLVALRTESSPK